jgi:hypothetical protein
MNARDLSHTETLRARMDYTDKVHRCTGKYQKNLRDQQNQRANLHTEYFPHADYADPADPYIIDVLKIFGNLNSVRPLSPRIFFSHEFNGWHGSMRVS